MGRKNKGNKNKGKWSAKKRGRASSQRKSNPKSKSKSAQASYPPLLVVTEARTAKRQCVREGSLAGKRAYASSLPDLHLSRRVVGQEVACEFRGESKEGRKNQRSCSYIRKKEEYGTHDIELQQQEKKRANTERQLAGKVLDELCEIVVKTGNLKFLDIIPSVFRSPPCLLDTYTLKCTFLENGNKLGGPEPPTFMLTEFSPRGTAFRTPPQFNKK